MEVNNQAIKRTQSFEKSNNQTRPGPVETHPCQYCEKPCVGKQCRDCHLKMVSKSKGKCVDCDQIFFAMRKDGTMRSRCKECQDTYNSKFMAACPGCKNSYHAILKDGRIFDKCFDCYKSSIKMCSKCTKNKTINGNELCPPCHKESIKTGTCRCGADTVNGYSLCISCHKASFEDRGFEAKPRGFQAKPRGYDRR